MAEVDRLARRTVVELVAIAWRVGPDAHVPPNMGRLKSYFVETFTSWRFL